MKLFDRVALVASKFLEVLHWAGTGLALALLAGSLAAGDRLGGVMERMLGAGAEVSVYGFSLKVIGADGGAIPGAATLLAVAAALIFALMAMVFRNVWLSLRTMEGKTWFAKGQTPFQEDVVRMVREIGIFLIAIPVVAALGCVAGRLALGPEGIEASVGFGDLVTGVLVLCLSQVFAYGQGLQADVDGLL